jgi:16S rRNA (uracil1498-N3)-methyltransferase
VQYLYHSEASASTLYLTGDEHRYIFRVRRHRAGESIYLRNLDDDILYRYLISIIDKKEALLELESQELYPLKATKYLHIGWCIIDPKSIEKALPTLNELGVSKVTFIYCKRSQKSFKIDFKRYQKILLNSSQQSGRSDMMRLELVDNLSEFMRVNPQSYLLNFSEKKLSSGSAIETIVVGCEGGLSGDEVELFESSRVVGLDTPLILRSESAVAVVGTLLVY